MTKHTPGPWEFWESRDAQHHRIFINRQIGCISVPHCGYIDPHGLIAAQQKANARLIAAAPELLDALGILMNRLEGIGGEHVTGMEGVDADLIKANAAIAKATGEHHDN